MGPDRDARGRRAHQHRWFLITMYGWSVMRRNAEVASDFVASHFKHLPNPFADPTYHRSSR